jgi:hypothetical protein
MTLETLREYVSNHLGQSLPTIGGNATFKVSERGSAFVFELESGKKRNESFDWINKSLRIFNQSRSIRTTDYSETQNASYVLGLLAAAENSPPPTNLVTDVQAIQNDSTTGPTTKAALIAARVGQGSFRDAILARWDCRCAVTGSGTLKAIRASHIKPWRLSSNTERLDPLNGLPLVANLDALFDGGLISFDHDGRLMISSSLSEAEITLFDLRGKVLRHPPCAGTNGFLEFHRTTVFVK